MTMDVTGGKTEKPPPDVCTTFEQQQQQQIKRKSIHFLDVGGFFCRRRQSVLRRDPYVPPTLVVLVVKTKESLGRRVVNGCCWREDCSQNRRRQRYLFVRKTETRFTGRGGLKKKKNFRFRPRHGYKTAQYNNAIAWRFPPSSTNSILEIGRYRPARPVYERAGAEKGFPTWTTTDSRRKK